MSAPERDPSPIALAAGDWCLRLAERRLAPEEVDAFEAWMSADPAHREAFDRASFIWRALDGRAAPPELVGIRMDALGALHEDEPAQAPAPARWRDWRAISAIAAAFVLVVIAGLVLLTGGPATYETGIGERRIVMLDDGSRLSLDAASEVSVDYDGDRRALRLIRGRARFDVARDPLRPFSVAAGDKLVVATGTSFSVELLTRRVEVVLYEGRVSVLRAPADGAAPRPVTLARGQHAEQALRPGTQLALADDGGGAASLTPVDPARTLSWEAGQLAFTDEPLARAAERMNRYSRTEIAVADLAAASLPISGVFNTNDPQSFVEGITGVFPIASERTGDRIVLRSAPAQ